mmetsp:Transcript_55823/g.163952  ORF Transcript_55823/g.163952 Transcript_55823/m.163952 type:complete len:222 (+) Transcript_55823:461-1126(+)
MLELASPKTAAHSSLWLAILCSSCLAWRSGASSGRSKAAPLLMATNALPVSAMPPPASSGLPSSLSPSMASTRDLIRSTLLAAPSAASAFSPRPCVSARTLLVESSDCFACIASMSSFCSAPCSISFVGAGAVRRSCSLLSMDASAVLWSRCSILSRRTGSRGRTLSAFDHTDLPRDPAIVEPPPPGCDEIDFASHSCCGTSFMSCSSMRRRASRSSGSPA